MKHTYKVLIIRHLLTEADYAEARIYYSDQEIRLELMASGLTGLINKMRSCRGAVESSSLTCEHGGHE